MSTDLICNEWENEGTAGMAAAMGAAERAGLIELLDGDTGHRRLLPRDVVAALTAEHGAFGVLYEAANGDARAVDDVIDADADALKARRAWGRFMLAIGVEVGMRYASAPVEMSTVAMTNAIGNAASWCDERSELAPMLRDDHRSRAA